MSQQSPRDESTWEFSLLFLSPLSLALVVASLLLARPSTAHASDNSQAPSEPLIPLVNEWMSSAHFGYAVETRSSTGFKGIGGSTAFFDFGYHLSDTVNIGVRSLAGGGRGAGANFYRLSAGPLVNVRIFDAVTASFSAGYFEEVGLWAATDASAYSSQGRFAMLGWERVYDVMARVELAWGAFFTRSWGNLARSEGSAPPNAKLGNARQNVSSSQGIEAALRVHL